MDVFGPFRLILFPSVGWISGEEIVLLSNLGCGDKALIDSFYK